MPKEKNLIESKVFIISMLCALTAIIVAAVGSIIAILAGSQQQVQSTISITYKADGVSGEMRLRAYYIEDGDDNASWHNLTGTDQNGFIQLGEESEENYTARDVAAVLDYTNHSIVFECAFKNEGSHIVKLSLTESEDTEQDNIIKFRRVTNEELGTVDFSYIDDDFSAYTSLAVLGAADANYYDDYVYYYALIRVGNLSNDAMYGSTHTWEFKADEEPINIILDNSIIGEDNTTIRALDGALLPIQENWKRANYIYDGIVPDLGNGQLKYVDGYGFPVLEFHTTDLTNENTVYNNYILAAAKVDNQFKYVAPVNLKWRLYSIDIPDDVDNIPDNAFSSCNNLGSVYIPKNIESISYAAFYSCNKLESVIFEEDSKLVTIGMGAFCQCRNLVNIVLPDSIEAMGASAFWRCDRLVSINIPSKVTEIDTQMFCECYNLESVTIPNGVTSIGKWAFGSCVKLTSISLPNGLQTIVDGAFDGSGLLTITIPASVTSIGKNAFISCTSLVSATIMDNSSLVSIGESAFYNCSSLVTFSLGANSQLASIGDVAFGHCSSLASITIPASITTFGDSIFAGCGNLRTVILDNQTIVNDLVNIDSRGSLIFYADTIYVKTGVTVPSGYITSNFDIVTPDRAGYVKYRKK